MSVLRDDGFRERESAEHRPPADNDLPVVQWERSREETLSDEQLDRIAKDADFVGAHHPYAPLMHVDLCCHIKALLEEREWILKRSVKRLRALERIEEYLKDRGAHSDACDCDLCQHIRIAQEAI